MKRSVLLLLLLAACLLCFSACSRDALQDIVDSGRTNPGVDSNSASGSSEDGPYDYEVTAQKLSADTTYCNGFLGFSYTIPSGWWLYSVNDDNFTIDPADTMDEDLLDISFGDNYEFLDMSYFGSLQYSSRDNHIGIDVSAERLIGVNTLEDYVEEYVDYMLEPYEGTNYALLGQDSIELLGHPCEVRVFEVGQEGGAYEMVSYTCAVENGYYLTLLGNYWPGNRNAQANIQKFIENGLAFL